MTGFKGDTGGQWRKPNSQTILPLSHGTVRKHRHETKVHVVQAHILNNVYLGVPCFNPGHQLCVQLHLPCVVVCAIVSLSSALTCLCVLL